MHKKKVMVVEDEPAIREVMKMMLEEVGYEVQTSNDGVSVQEMRENLPDLVLLDLRVSGIHGKDICKHLKGQDLTKHIPIIIISANYDIAKITSEAGADCFIAKPFDMAELLSKVEYYLYINPLKIKIGV